MGFLNNAIMNNVLRRGYVSGLLLIENKKSLSGIRIKLPIQIQSIPKIKRMCFMNNDDVNVYAGISRK